MRPTPDQIERQRLVSLWRRHYEPMPDLGWCDYEPVGVMLRIGVEWPLDDFYDGPTLRPTLRPDQYPPNLPYTGASVRERVISNRPPRPETTTPELELPDEFPY